MTGKKNPTLVFTTFRANAPVTFELIAQAFLEGYVLQRHGTLNTIGPRVDYLRAFFGGQLAEAITTVAAPQPAPDKSKTVGSPSKP